MPGVFEEQQEGQYHNSGMDKGERGSRWGVSQGAKCSAVVSWLVSAEECRTLNPIMGVITP